MIFLHDIPIKGNAKHVHYIEEAIPKIDDEVEILGTVTTVMIFFEHSISKLDFKAKLWINTHET